MQKILSDLPKMFSLSFQQFLLLFLFLTLHSSYQSIRNNRHKAVSAVRVGLDLRKYFVPQHNIGSTDHLLQDEEDTKEKLGVSKSWMMVTYV